MSKAGRENRADEKMMQAIERGASEPFKDRAPNRISKKYKEPEYYKDNKTREANKIAALKALRLSK